MISPAPMRAAAKGPRHPAVAEHDHKTGDVFPPVPANDPSLQPSRLLPNVFDGYCALGRWLRLPEGLERGLRLWVSHGVPSWKPGEGRAGGRRPPHTPARA